jgi:autotransporter translocation and assembly factor TamB
MEKNPKKTFSKLQMNSILLIVGLISPLLLYVGLSSGADWLTWLSSALLVATMLAVIVVK